jgi:DUF971 family protein
MQPTDLQPVGNELAIRWEDGNESYIRLDVLRRRCPCAGCRGEVDILGQVHGGGAQSVSPAAFQLRQLIRVGGYAVQPVWADGHATGLYTFDYLRQIAERPAETSG